MSTDVSYHLLGQENASQLDGADVFDNPVDQVQLDRFVADPGHELVFATMGEKVVGIASGTVLLHPDKHPEFFINEVAVNEDMRIRGIGTALTKLLMNVARTKGYKGIWLATEMDNVEARALYRKLDARETDAIVVYDWDSAMDE